MRIQSPRIGIGRSSVDSFESQWINLRLFYFMIMLK